MDNLQVHFSDITELIRRAKYEAIRKVNTDLIHLYWRIGAYISERTIKDNWGKQSQMYSRSDGSMPFRVERNDVISSWPERTDGRADG